MRQEIYEDEYGSRRLGSASCEPVLRHHRELRAVADAHRTSGRRPSRRPRGTTADAGLPWFDFYGGDLEALAETEKMRGLVSVAQLGLAQKGQTPLPDNESVETANVVTLRAAGATQVREMPAVGA